jgi:hypothetical protein
VNRFLITSLALLAGCSSLVDNYCARGYEREDGTCVVRSDEVDGGIVAVSPDARMPVGNFDPDPTPHPDAAPEPDAPAPDAPAPDAAPTPDAPVCSADLMTDPDHCGSCSHQCASGICTAGHCEGEPWGHIVAIGHDYTASHASQRRVLANAVSLAPGADLGVAWWPSLTASSAHRQALLAGMTSVGRAWHEAVFPTAPNNAFDDVDVVLVAPDARDGDTSEQDGAAWATAFDTFLRRGGVIVVLEGAGGTNYRFAHGAQLFDVGAPVTVTGQPTAVVDGTDGVAQQVVAPYLAESSSVTWANAPQPVVTTMGGTDAIVFHVTR